MPSEIPQTHRWECFLVSGNLSFLRLPSWDGSPSLPLLSLSFIFCPTSSWRQWAAFLCAWCTMPAFRSCFVEFAQRSNVLSVNLWGRKWSPRPISLPSYDHPLTLSLFGNYIWLREMFVGDKLTKGTPCNSEFRVSIWQAMAPRHLVYMFYESEINIWISSF